MSAHVFLQRPNYSNPCLQRALRHSYLAPTGKKGTQVAATAHYPSSEG